MADLDPQVQIKLIDVAHSLTAGITTEERNKESHIKKKASYFDIAYKAMVKTVKDAEKSPSS